MHLEFMNIVKVCNRHLTPTECSNTMGEVREGAFIWLQPTQWTFNDFSHSACGSLVTGNTPALSNTLVKNTQNELLDCMLHDAMLLNLNR